MKLDDVIQQLDADAVGKKRLMMGPLRALAKKVKTDHPLALSLWATGRTDARMLAAMVMAPEKLTAKEAAAMIAPLTDYLLVDELSGVIAGSPGAEDLSRKWVDSKEELTARAGWSLTRSRIGKGLQSSDCDTLLKTIDARKKSAPVKAQETMMRCLVEIGVRFPEHRERAIDIGTRWGVIDDRPVPKGCTPFQAVMWIEAILKRQK